MGTRSVRVVTVAALLASLTVVAPPGVDARCTGKGCPFRPTALAGSNETHTSPPVMP